MSNVLTPKSRVSKSADGRGSVSFHMHRLMGVIAFVLCFAISSFAQTFTSRPEQKAIEAADLSRSLYPPNWNHHREGLLKAIAALLVLYPHQEIYFLARDGEYLYDMASVLFEDNPSVLNRIHLLNVSSKSKKSQSLLSYLSQEGISSESLESKEIVVVDSGFLGTIPQAIKSLFSLAAQAHIKTHMLASHNRTIPSLRVFFESMLRGPFNKNDIDLMTIEFQELPHHDTQSIDYAMAENRLKPVSLNEQTPLLRALSLRLMQDIKYFARLPETRLNMAGLLENMNALLSCMKWGTCSEIELQDLRAKSETLGIKSFTKDLLEAGLAGTVEIRFPYIDETDGDLERLAPKDREGLLGLIEQKFWRGTLYLKNQVVGQNNKRFWKRVEDKVLVRPALSCENVFAF